MIGLTKAVALQYAKDNMRVNALCPGVTATAMIRQTMDRDEAARKMIEGHAPIGRVADPREVAEAAIWLASGAASFITGHALVVDGGFLAQ
ncbi:3-oxoacyl-[acyl-carrier protein] reductase [Rhodococcus wratislaviensis]|uniref:3-oxoacyl-[acyl-carrier protein] reductase n=1 Tax=Rhodococcus wratislaviensis TaxID=44752 RepID=A0A402CDD4_RHOWR|nr:3-oxoacyl-[acyl-carrier protein] reductase [Rhodococcus wratislaviensis]